MVVVVTARPNALLVVVTIPTDVETPLNVDAGSTTSGVSVVASELPVVVSVATTTLVTNDPDKVATVHNVAVIKHVIAIVVIAK